MRLDTLYVCGIKSKRSNYTLDKKEDVRRKAKAYVGFLSLFPAAAAILALISILIPGCVPQDPCHIEQTILPIRIDGGHHIYFDARDFGILSEPSFVRESITLTVAFRGHKGKKESLSFSLNGAFATSGDHYPAHHFKEYQDQDDSSHFDFDLHRMKLSGVESIEAMILRILAHKGRIEISPLGKDVHVISAKIVIKGRMTTCPNPQPTPTPTPAPQTKIDSVSPTGNVVASTTMSITFSSDQVGATFACSLDDVATAACSSPQSYSGLANGAHTFKVVATSSSGTPDPAGASYSWSIDTIAPNVTLLNATSLPANTNSTSISLEFASADATYFTCAIDNGQFAACASPVSYGGLAEGIHQIAVNAIDDAGNNSAQPAVFQWNIDLTAPRAWITNVTPAQIITNSTSSDISFAASETATFECAIDQASFSSCSSPLALWNLSEGSHSVEVRAVDLAGNIGVPASHAWTVDVTAPVLTAGTIIPPTGPTNASSVSVEFSASEAADFSCAFDGAAAGACSSPFSASISSEGPHRLVIQARDQAGNDSAPVVMDWNMDFTLPILSWGAMTPSAASRINSTFFSAEIVATENTSLSYAVNGFNFGPTTSPLKLANLAEGDYIVAIAGVDLAGNMSASLTHSFTVDLTAPEASVAGTSGITNKTSNTITFSANEAASFECNVDSTGFATCVSPLTLSGLAEGSHNIQIRPQDAAGNVGQTVPLDWSIDLTAPSTTLAVSRTSNTDISFSFSANEAVRAFECSIDGAAFATCQSPKAFSSLAAGNHTFTVRATDLAGNVEKAATSHAWTVDPALVTSIVSVSPSNSPTNQSSITINFSANVSAVTFACSIDGGAASTCASPKIITSLADGQHSIAIHAVDRFGALDPNGASYSWIVDTIPPTNTLTTTRNENTSISFAFTANEAVSDFVCALDGAAFTTCQSPLALSGLAVGDHNLAVRATDLAGNIGGTASYSWTVDPPLSTSIGSVTPSAAFTNQDSLEVSFSTNLTPATFVCSIDGGTGMACTSPKKFSGLTDGQHRILVQAIDRFGLVDAKGATYAWTIDKATPVTTLTPSRGSNTSMSFSFTASESVSGFACSLDGAAFGTCQSPISYSGLAVGNHAFTVRATDLAGNVEAIGPSYGWTVDAPPSTTITSVSVAQGSYTRQTTITFTLSSSASGASFMCAIDNGAAAPCAASVTYSSLPDGYHLFTAYSVTQSGESGPAAVYSWTIDLRAPLVMSLATTSTSTSVKISWTTNELATTALTWGLGSLTNNVVPDDEIYAMSHAVSLSGLLPDTVYSFKIGGHDQAGNTILPTSRAFLTNP